MLKFIEVLMGPTEGHYQDSFPTNWLEQKIGGRDDRKAKENCR